MTFQDWQTSPIINILTVQFGISHLITMIALPLIPAGGGLPYKDALQVQK